MKITAQNLGKEWDNIKGKLPKELVKIGEDSFIPFIKMLDDFDEDMMKDLELFIEKVNKFTDKEDEPKPKAKAEVKPKPKAKAEPKQEAKPKTEKKPETEKKSEKEKDPKKESKKKIGESPKWLKTLQSFVKSFAGKTKDTWRVRAFVEDIQAYFSKKHGNATPNIDLIREIQDKLLPYANSDKKKVEIPAYADLVAKCKKAAKDKDFTVSNKVKKSDLKNAELSGFTTGFNNLSGFKIGFGK